MISFLDLVRMRESTRRYDPSRPVAREAIERCLEAARLAPSACNSQPWTFYVADRDPLRRELAEASCTGLYRMNRFALDSPVLVAVVTEKSRFAARCGAKFRGMQYSRIDVGIAIEHFVLQAAEEGVGTCWLGWFNERAVRRILGLPRRSQVDILLTMGYAATPGPPVRKIRRELSDMGRFVCGERGEG